LHSPFSSLMRVAAFPLESNSSHDVQNVALVQVAHGSVQSSHLSVAVFPKVPPGQSLVHLVPTRNSATGFPQLVQLARLVDKQLPQFSRHGWQTLLMLT